MKILFVGDIVGGSGRRAFAWHVQRMKNARTVDFVVANCENAAAGRGITPALVRELLDAGADMLTLGDHAWDQKEMVAGIDSLERVVRPVNFAPACPGRGCVMMDTPHGKIAVVNLIGRVFMSPADCPFRAVDEALKRISAARFVVVDFHAEATSEKIAMGRYLDGRVAALVGTHTHVQTADETILPRGTAYITDLGMTGPCNSIIGRGIDTILKRFTTGMPAKFEIAGGEAKMEGLLVDMDEKSGKPRSVRRVRENMPLSHACSQKHV